MADTYVIKGKKVKLDQNDFIASGGQGSVFRHKDQAVKIYHDPKNMIPLDKFRELAALDRYNILGPRDIVTDKFDRAVGYTMPFVDRTNPLCQLFVRNFRDDNGISPQDIVDLIKAIQETINFIHGHDCVMVDGNEMNYLVSNDFKIPYFLDVDSWATKKHPKATVIMESIRDRLVKKGQYSKLSDWFAFAVIITQLYLGIHPYRGRHPKYKPTAWQKRMDDGISIFDPDVTLPPSVQDWSAIPKSHRGWLEAVFTRNERSIPPMPDGTLVLAAALTRIIRSSGSFEVEEWLNLAERPRTISLVGQYAFFGGKTGVYNDQAPLKLLHSCVTKECKSYKRVYVASSNTGSPVYCKWDGDTAEFYSGQEHDKPFATQQNVKAIFSRGDRVYAVSKGRLYFMDCTEVQRGRFILAPRSIGRVLENSGTVYQGLIHQDILGKAWIMIPYTDRHNYFQHIPELDDFRITDARSEKNIAVFMGEKDGKYHRIILVFDPEFKKYEVRIDQDVPKEALNFTVLQNGVCVMAVENGEVEVFRDHKKVSRYDQSPFDTTMKLFNIESQVCFVDGKKVYKVRMK